MEEKSIWYVYLLECGDGSFYAGITKNIQKRMKAHKDGRGSKYVRSRGFKTILKTKSFSSKSSALKAEYKLKQLNKEMKLKFFE